MNGKPQPKPKSNNNGKGAGKTIAGKGKKGKDGKGEQKLQTVTAIFGDKKVKIVRQTATKRFCMGFNQNDDCDGNCGWEHKCSVMITPTKVCGGNHAACDHKGKIAKAD